MDVSLKKNHMGIETFIIHYGYAVILAGTFFEGETVLVLAGFLVHRGYLSFPLVVLAAFAGTFAGDQLFFHIGRKKGMPYLERHPAMKANSARVRRMLLRNRDLVIMGFRFVYGIRTATPFILGAIGIPAARFFTLNALGGFLWSLVVAALGYMLGHTAEIFLQDMKRYETFIMAAIAAAGIIAWVLYSMDRKKRNKRMH